MRTRELERDDLSLFCKENNLSDMQTDIILRRYDEGKLGYENLILEVKRVAHGNKMLKGQKELF
jgi:hypothetical protein